MPATENADQGNAVQLADAQPDDRLVRSVDIARDAAADEAGPENVGEHVGTEPEDGAITHLFTAELAGYRGWRWAVTVAHGGAADTPVTVSEVVLLPGPDALVGATWVPWSERVQAGDLGVGDVVLTPPDDERLVPGYLDSGDQQVLEVNDELGLGRARVLSREGREEAADRWKDGEFGPRSDMARSAAGSCGTCGFYVQLGGSLRAAFGACGNELAPADGHVVHAEYGCGAHSEAEVDTSPMVPVAALVYDDSQLDIQPTRPTESTVDVGEVEVGGPDAPIAERATTEAAPVAGSPVADAGAVADQSDVGPVTPDEQATDPSTADVADVPSTGAEPVEATGTAADADAPAAVGSPAVGSGATADAPTLDASDVDVAGASPVGGEPAGVAGAVLDTDAGESAVVDSPVVDSGVTADVPTLDAPAVDTAGAESAGPAEAVLDTDAAVVDSAAVDAAADAAQAADVSAGEASTPSTVDDTIVGAEPAGVVGGVIDSSAPASAVSVEPVAVEPPAAPETAAFIPEPADDAAPVAGIEPVVVVSSAPELAGEPEQSAGQPATFDAAPIVQVARDLEDTADAPEPSGTAAPVAPEPSTVEDTAAAEGDTATGDGTPSTGR